MTYKVKDGFVVRKIGAQIMAMPVGKRTSQFHGMVALSESGALLWEALTHGATVQSLADILLEHYEVDAQRALSDVEAFLEGLHRQGVLE